MTPEIGVSVNLATDERLDLSFVGERTGLATEFLMMAGDPRVTPNGRVWPNPAPRSIWQYQVPNRETFDLQGVVVEVLGSLEAVRDEFLSIIDEFSLDAWLSVHAHLDGETPDGTLTAVVMNRLAALELDLDLDLYVPGTG
ncbi:MAG: hypothetical protein JWM89_1489 [Acidimicrobiales bacterium]|nr:hypothetical protein [Acidimicrobiales bacterium]